mgnify:CR=1 FL=1
MNKKTKTIVFSALMAAIIAVCTRFTAFGIPATEGYVHIGDTFVLLSATILPLPYAVMASAVGGALADLMYGSAMYMIPTAIIKALMALTVGKSSGTKILTKKTILRAILSVPVLVLGYYIAEVIIFGSFATPLMSMLWNTLQGVFSVIAFTAVSAALDAAKFKSRI